MTAKLGFGGTNGGELVPDSEPKLAGPIDEKNVDHWNETFVDFEPLEFIEEALDRHAVTTPRAMAVVCGEQSLTYAELKLKSDDLARHLRSQNMGPEDIIGILLERSVDIVVSIFAVLKTGAAFLPLDPSHPMERLCFMLKDAGARLLITNSKLSEGEFACRILKVDKELEVRGCAHESPLVRSHHDKNAAYVVYTSGTTGKPKGVVVTHRNLFFSNKARLHYYKQKPECFLLVASISVDGALGVIFWTLSTGCRLVIAEESVRKDVRQLSLLIQQHQISHLMCLPSLYSLLLDEYLHLGSLRNVIVAAETCPIDLVLRHKKWMSRAELFNEYGPTEGTVWCTVFKCDPSQIETVVPIGKPVANYNIYILDDAMKPVDIGVKGELYIGGEGVARGYLNRVELSEEKFIPDPFDRSRDSRLYRTGDFARYKENGDIEFLGRLDGQVKIRGHRVELEEIQAVLSRHPGIKECVVLPKCDSSSQCCISAFITLRRDASLELKSLKRYLERKLPDFMIPSFFIFIDEMPLAPNGKVDRQKLIHLGDQKLARSFSPPVSLLESNLAEIWKDVLKVEPLGVQDHFFDLGGDSLKALKLVSKIKTNLKVQVSLSDIFHMPTISALGQHLENRIKSPV